MEIINKHLTRVKDHKYRVTPIIHLPARTLYCVFFLVSLLFAQWNPDQRLTVNDSVSWTSYNNAHAIAAGPDGVLHVVWHDQRNGGLFHDEIYYKRSTDGGVSWDIEDTRLTNDPAWSYLSSVAASGSNVHVVWSDNRDDTFAEIYYKRSTDGGVSWSSEDTRLTNDPALSYNPSLSASGSDVHVVWWDTRDGPDEIYYKRSTDAGVSWDLEDTRLTDSWSESKIPSISVSDSNVHVVWHDNRDGNYEIYYKRSTDNGNSWDSVDTRLTNDSAESAWPSVSVSGSNVHVVWYDTRDGNYEIYYKRSTDNGSSWDSVDTRLTNDVSESIWPSVWASGQNVHTAWRDDRDGNYEIYYKRSTDAGTSWDFVDTRLTNAADMSSQPALVCTDTMVHVVWADGRDGNLEIYYKCNPTGNPTSIVENKSLQIHDQIGGPLHASPNPFCTFTRILGYEREWFTLYDVSGMKVGTYLGSCIGMDVGSGVYFLKKKQTTTVTQDLFLRIVKVK